MSIELLMPSNYLIFWSPLLLPPSIFPRIRVFSNESVLCIRWQKYWSLNFKQQTSNEYSGLISFRMNSVDLLAVQGTQESSPTPQFKTSILQHSAFFIVQLSHSYMTTGKAIALTRWTFVGKVMSLLFNTLSRLVSPGGLQSMGSLGVWHYWTTSLSLFTFMHWRRKWQPTPVFLPGESQGRGSLMGCRLWGSTESDMTEVT